MPTMTAYRLFGRGDARTTEVPIPEPGAGEILVRVAGVGLCHSDLGFIAGSADGLGTLPYTLGHETAGWVERPGPGTSGWTRGEAVVAAAHWWCGECGFCRRGEDHLCSRQRGGPGYGCDGGLAEFAVVPQNALVALGTLDPRHAGPLADAAATAYRVVRGVAHRLADDSPVVVVGAGGLGGCAVRLLRRLTPARVVVVDVSAASRADALAAGADEALGAVAGLGDRTAAAVLDFVGSEETLSAAARVVRPGGAISLVGAAGGRLPVGWGTIPPECAVRVCLGNTMADLRAVVALAATGGLALPVEEYPFAEVERAYDRLRAGSVRGRAVVLI